MLDEDLDPHWPRTRWEWLGLALTTAALVASVAGAGVALTAR